MGDQLSDYRDALDFLFARTTGKNKFGLERIDALLHHLGDPHRRVRALHVAGTNGKGSVCATLEALLRWRGLRVGKYTSPHLVDFRERFLVNGAPIEPEFVVDFVRDRVTLVEALGATFFEATTAMAFDWFVRQDVDILVLETGLGGRLDATNVIQPLVAGVSSIGIDHVEYLGDTREAIAAEKAGIFKRGAGAVIGEPDLTIAGQLVEAATVHGSRPIVDVWRSDPPRAINVDATGTTFELSNGTCRTPLLGAHQASNAAMALAMLRLAGSAFALTPEAERDALQSVRLPGRFHQVGPFIFDVAHNADGATVLAQTVEALGIPRPIACVLCVLGDKDWRSIIDALAPAVDTFLLVNAPTAPTSRMWDIDGVAEYATVAGWNARVDSDFDHALLDAQRRGSTVLVTGSFHTVGDAMARLQVDPLAR